MKKYIYEHRTKTSKKYVSLRKYQCSQGSVYDRRAELMVKDRKDRNFTTVLACKHSN